MPAVLPQAKAGKLRPLAVGTAKRSPALPDVPTVAESGYPGFAVSLWLGFFAPRGTPIEIVNRLHAELANIALSPDMKEQFERNGAEPMTNASNLELERLIRSEIPKYAKVIKAANIKID
jgi:tripartite-type tricarboxylate transporter receptor subunit TctC